MDCQICSYKYSESVEMLEEKENSYRFHFDDSITVSSQKDLIGVNVKVQQR